MSDHHPDCIYSAHITRDGEVWCICEQVKSAEQRGYTKGYNECARAQQRSLAEYGGRPKVPDYAAGRADERRELWRLLEPVVTEIALRNGTGEL